MRELRCIRILDASGLPMQLYPILKQMSGRDPLPGTRKHENERKEIYVRAVPTIVTNEPNFQLKDEPLLERLTLFYLALIFPQTDLLERIILIENNDDYGWSGPLDNQLGHTVSWIFGLYKRKEFIRLYVAHPEKYVLSDEEFYQRFYRETNSLTFPRPEAFKS